MMTNKYFRTLTLSLCTLSIVLLPIRAAHAFSGGVTTYTSPSADTVSRARSFPAKTPELDITYQRTMRTAQSAAAAATAMGKILRVVSGISTVLAVAQLARELNGIWTKDSAGNNVLEVDDLDGCNATSCTVWTAQSTDGQFKTADAACSALASRLNASATAGYGYVNTGNYSAYGARLSDRCKVTQTFPPVNGVAETRDLEYYLSGATTTRPQTAARKTLSSAELDTKIIPIVLPLLKELDDKGLPVTFPAPEVEDMPQPIAISPVTTTHSDGSKTISQTTLEPYRADNNDVQWRKKETLTEVSKPSPDGSTTTKTDTTTSDSGKASTPEKAPEEPATDTPLPGQPKLYKQRYPEGITGVWKTQHDLMAATPLFTLAKGLMPTVANSGQCPTMPVNLTLSKWANFGVKDVAPPCQVWDWGRAICIVSALLLARQLIFGG